VFIDETCATTNMTRRYGRRKRGQRLVCKVPNGRWKTSTFIAALRHDRVTAPVPTISADHAYTVSGVLTAPLIFSGEWRRSDRI
jgi:hypothetical protein